MPLPAVLPLADMARAPLAPAPDTSAVDDAGVVCRTPPLYRNDLPLSLSLHTYTSGPDGALQYTGEARIGPTVAWNSSMTASPLALNLPMFAVETRNIRPSLPPPASTLVPGSRMGPEEPRSQSLAASVAWLYGLK